MKHYKPQGDLESRLFSNAHGAFIESNHILGKREQLSDSSKPGIKH